MQHTSYIMQNTYFVTEWGKIHHPVVHKQSISPAALELLAGELEVVHAVLVVEVVLEPAAVAAGAAVVVPAFFQCALQCLSLE